jgi:hypothetical protein
VKAFPAAILLVILARGETTRPIAGRIRIEKTASGAVRFSPAETVSWAGGQLHWFNDTAEAHEPGVIRKDGSFVAFLDEPVAPRAVSGVFSPQPRIDSAGKQVPFSIHYVCGRHREEKGDIQVIPTP